MACDESSMFLLCTQEINPLLGYSELTYFKMSDILQPFQCLILSISSQKSPLVGCSSGFIQLNQQLIIVMLHGFVSFDRAELTRFESPLTLAFESKRAETLNGEVSVVCYICSHADLS